MRSSASNTDRRSGLTLLEVIIAVTIFSVVAIVALGTMNESSDAARLSTIQSDLRRVGEKVLNDMVKDFRSTQNCYVGAALFPTVAPNGYALDYAKVLSFDTGTSVPKLEGNTASPAWNTLGASTVIYRYRQGPGSCSVLGGNPHNGYLFFEKGTLTSYSTAPPLRTTLSQELALPSDSTGLIPGDPDWPYAAPAPRGFEVTIVPSATIAGYPVALPGLLSTSSGRFGTPGAASPPVTLRLKLTLKRAQGLSRTNTKTYVWTTVETFVELRPDQSY